MLRNRTHVRLLQERSSGILLPLFSLPSNSGIGDMGPDAVEFIYFLKKSGQRFWQLLPLSPISSACGNSPYMSFAAFAGNPLYISPDLLIRDGLLQEGEIPQVDFSEYSVDYLRVSEHKRFILQTAWRHFQKRASWQEELDTFLRAYPWMSDYGLFLSLKNKFQQCPWFQWPEPLRLRQETALREASKELAAEISYFIFEQYLFFTQWEELKKHANEQNVRLIGDVPIYVALDSVDVWTHQSLFHLNRQNGMPTHVAGVPPDYFSATGQHWGNPLYRWNSDSKTVQEELWTWWEKRLRLNLTLCDIVRLDHFRGFAAYWSIPASEKTAIKGSWIPGPGEPFFQEMERRLGDLPVIAEDLGIITPDVEKMRLACGYPGMKVLLFAFDGKLDNAYLPYNIEKNSVVYTGTHDNDTAVGWYLNPAISGESKRQAKIFANRDDNEAGSFHKNLLYLALSSAANTAILPMQDVLGFGNDCRINVPGTIEGNWQWRCAPRFLNEGTAACLHDMTEYFGRISRMETLDKGKDADLMTTASNDDGEI